MRVTLQTKEETRQRILLKAHKLFVHNGFDNTSTRQIASAAKIATGTVFNYFTTKEALGATLLGEAMELAFGDYESRRRGGEGIAEDLFLFMAACLRRLEPYRSYLPPIVETALSPFVRSSVCQEGERVRVEHLEKVADMLHRRGVEEPSAIALHLYWTLFLGVLAFWSRDASPKQEDTLALLDQSIRLFVSSLGTSISMKEASHGA